MTKDRLKREDRFLFVYIQEFTEKYDSRKQLEFETHVPSYQGKGKKKKALTNDFQEREMGPQENR